MTEAPGTTLIEVLLYLMLSSMVLVGTMSIVMHLYSFITEHIRREDELMQLASGLACLRHDIHEFSSLKEYRAHRLIGTLKGRDCMWWVKKKRLIRSYGTYDQQKRMFYPHSHSLIAASVSSLSCTYSVHNGVVVGVTCTLLSPHHELSLSVALEKSHE